MRGFKAIAWTGLVLALGLAGPVFADDPMPPPDGPDATIEAPAHTRVVLGDALTDAIAEADAVTVLRVGDRAEDEGAERIGDRAVLEERALDEAQAEELQRALLSRETILSRFTAGAPADTPYGYAVRFEKDGERTTVLVHIDGASTNGQITWVEGDRAVTILQGSFTRLLARMFSKT